MYDLPRDIARCAGQGCDVREQCLRFLATRSDFQWYIQPDPKDCHYFIRTDLLEDTNAVQEQE